MEKNMPKTKSIFKNLFLALLLSPAAGAWAGAPLKFNFQGRLNENGQPADGTKAFVFKIYDVQSGGSAVWTSETQDIGVSDGIFTTVLSTGTPADLSTATFSGARYIEITVDGVPLSPRQEMVSAPYALVAQSLAPDAELPPATILAASVTDYHVLLTTSAISSGKFGDDRVQISTAVISGLGALAEAGAEADPVFTGHAAYGVSVTSITLWNAAYGWGNHASAGYATTAGVTSALSSYAALSATQVFTGANTFASTAAFTAQEGSAPGVTVSSGLAVLGGNVGLGTGSPNSTLSVSGSLSLPIRTITADADITDSDFTVLIDASGGAVTATLPTAVGRAGRIYVVKAVDVTNTATLAARAGETIDGESQYGNTPPGFVNDGDLVHCQSDGSNWVIITRQVQWW